MSARVRLLLAVVGLLIICLALAGLAYSLWPLENNQDRFVLPVELVLFPIWGFWVAARG